MRPKARKSGVKRKKSIKGASVCMNVKCPLYLAGRATQNRDAQAAMCIALAGASLSLTGETMHPFSADAALRTELNALFTVPHTG